MKGMGKQTGSGLQELKQRLWFVFWGLVVFRIGAHIPVPGIDPARLQDLFSNLQGNILGLANAFSGGALQRLSIFALGIMPYISASIIMQLLTAVSPKLEQLKKEGETGRRKIAQYTRYGTLLLATFQGYGMSRVLAVGPEGATLIFTFTTTVTLVTGTMFLMWLGERITERGVGNGISLIIFAGIVSGLPSTIGNTFESVRQGNMPAIGLVLLIMMMLGVCAFIVFVERGQRRITVNYAKRQQGRKMYAAQQSHLPLKINMAGVIPPIFASSLILFPATLGQWFGNQEGGSGIFRAIGTALQPGQLPYLLLLAAGIMFFCFFYTALMFNPKETSDNLKRSGAFIPGIRPGEQTAGYIDKVMTRLTLVGGLYITGVAIMPEILNYRWQVPFYFGGTSLLIVVVVVMDFIAQVQAHLMSQQYESMLKKANHKGKGGNGPGGGFGLLG